MSNIGQKIKETFFSLIKSIAIIFGVIALSVGVITLGFKYLNSKAESEKHAAALVNKIDINSRLLKIEHDRAKMLVDTFGLDAYDKVKQLTMQYPIPEGSRSTLLNSPETDFNQLGQAFETEWDKYSTEIAETLNVNPALIDDFRDAYFLNADHTLGFNRMLEGLDFQLQQTGFSLKEYIYIMRNTSPSAANSLHTMVGGYDVSYVWLKETLEEANWDFETFQSDIRNVKEGFPKDFVQSDIDLAEWYNSYINCREDYRSCKSTKALITGWKDALDLRQACRKYVDGAANWGEPDWKGGIYYAFPGFAETQRYKDEGVIVLFDNNVTLKNAFGGTKAADIRCEVDIETKRVLSINDQR